MGVGGGGVGGASQRSCIFAQSPIEMGAEPRADSQADSEGVN